MSVIRDSGSDELYLSGTRMLDLDDKSPCFHLRVIKCLGNVVDGAERHPDNCQESQKDVTGLLVLTQAHQTILSSDPSGAS